MSRSRPSAHPRSPVRNDFTAARFTRTGTLSTWVSGMCVRRLGRWLYTRRRSLRVLDRGRRVHAPHEPGAGRDDAGGRGRRRSVNDSVALLDRRRGFGRGPIAPACGLYLVGVGYGGTRGFRDDRRGVAGSSRRGGSVLAGDRRRRGGSAPAGGSARQGGRRRGRSAPADGAGGDRARGVTACHVRATREAATV